MLKSLILLRIMLIILLLLLLFSITRSLRKIKKRFLRLKKNYNENLTKKIIFKKMKTDTIVLFIRARKIIRGSIFRINKIM